MWGLGVWTRSILMNFVSRVDLSGHSCAMFWTLKLLFGLNWVGASWNKKRSGSEKELNNGPAYILVLGICYMNSISSGGSQVFLYFIFSFPSFSVLTFTWTRAY
ncbi:hypothetical protein QBC43DRAFT_117201 [Cladorrhinum sp. PSN259]|nr:hypothetical protein QBC43DRAFT_117201 [Cladorrhinum sp. PSN259]